jgi:hypothetical protein
MRLLTRDQLAALMKMLQEWQNHETCILNDKTAVMAHVCLANIY